MNIENEPTSNESTSVHLANDPVSRRFRELEEQSNSFAQQMKQRMEQRENDSNGENLLHTDQIVSSSTDDARNLDDDDGSGAENDMNVPNMHNDQSSSSQAIDAQNVCFL